jgi:hypothetical protein
MREDGFRGKCLLCHEGVNDRAWDMVNQEIQRGVICMNRHRKEAGVRIPPGTVEKGRRSRYNVVIREEEGGPDGQ